MASSRRILVSGERANFTILELDINAKSITVVANYKAPVNASWVELSSSQGDIDYLTGLSEEETIGSLYTFEVDHGRKTCNITSQRPTSGAPAHFITLRDKSALALSTYMGGSLALYPVSATGKDNPVLVEALQTETRPEFPYNSTGHGPNKARQDQCHAHQVIEDKRGLLYVPDLGSDRVWIYHRQDMELDLQGWLQCPAGSGPRHGVLAQNDNIMYIIGELSHEVTAYDISTTPVQGIEPIKGFVQNITPPSVKPHHRRMLDSAELCPHPTIPNVLYASNRWVRHIAKLEPALKDVPTDLPSGDDVAIVLLSDDGREVRSLSHVRTNVDVIRGMRLSDDGRFAVVVGQEGGGVEVYEISGERGDIWTRVAGLEVSALLESGIKHAIWL